MGLGFQYIQLAVLFGLLLVLLILFLFYLRWKRRVKKKMGEPKLVQLLMGNFSSRRFNTKFFLAGTALAMGVLAVMNLREPDNDGEVRKGIDVAIAMDVSNSMLATDLSPDRLSRAKEFLNKLLTAMPDDRFALVWFAGQAYLQMPLSTDHGAARMYLASAGPTAVPQQGTVIKEALERSADVFNTAERRYKTIILLTDGEDHDAEAVATAEGLAKEGVMINTVGVGSEQGGKIPVPEGGFKKNDFGSDVVTKLNEEVLKEVAIATHGVYTRLQDPDEAVKRIKQQLSGIEKTAYGDLSLMNYISYFWWFAAAMLLLLVLELFIPEIKTKKQ